jgi:hypothetical protein
MRTFLTRALAGVAVTATAVAAAAGIAGTASATTKKPTNLSIVAIKSTITAGQWDTIAGTLRAGATPEPKKVIELYRWDFKHKKWSLTRATLTNKAGTAKFTFKPAFTDKWELIFHGNGTLAASHSGVVTIVVKPAKIHSTLTATATPPAITAGAATTISGVLTAHAKPVVKALVFLYRYNPSKKKWVEIDVNLTGPKGGVAFVRKPSVTATFDLVYFGNSKIAGTHSAPVTVTVTPPPPAA